MARIIRAHNRYTAQIQQSVGVIFDDDADRNSFTKLSVRDIGTISFQLDTKQFYILQDLAPPVWVPFGGNTGDFLTKEEHGALEPTEFIHTTIALEFADAAARTSFAGVAGDIGKVARQLDDDSLWMLQDLAPTWLGIGTGAGVTSHLGLSNLTGAGTDGDAGHSQMVLNSGRAGGQAIPGGTGAGENLFLRSTTDLVKGDVIVADRAVIQAGMLMENDEDFIPDADGQGRVGTSGARFAEVNAVVVNAGDLRFEDKDKGAAWRVIEEPDKLVLVNEVTKRQYAFMLRPLNESEYVYWPGLGPAN